MQYHCFQPGDNIRHSNDKTLNSYIDGVLSITVTDTEQLEQHSIQNTLDIIGAPTLRIVQNSSFELVYIKPYGLQILGKELPALVQALATQEDSDMYDIAKTLLYRVAVILSKLSKEGLTFKGDQSILSALGVYMNESTESGLEVAILPPYHLMLTDKNDTFDLDKLLLELAENRYTARYTEQISHLLREAFSNNQ